MTTFRTLKSNLTTLFNTILSQFKRLLVIQTSVWNVFKADLHSHHFEAHLPVLTLVLWPDFNHICLPQYLLDCPWVSRPSGPTCICPRHPSATHWATPPRAYITQLPPVTTATSRLPMAWWQVNDHDYICSHLTQIQFWPLILIISEAFWLYTKELLVRDWIQRSMMKCHLTVVTVLHCDSNVDSKQYCCWWWDFTYW